MRVYTATGLVTFELSVDSDRSARAAGRDFIRRHGAAPDTVTNEYGVELHVVGACDNCRGPVFFGDEYGEDPQDGVIVHTRGCPEV